MANLMTFRADTVDAALACARARLGDELLVVTTRAAAGGGVELIAMPGRGERPRRDERTRTGGRQARALAARTPRPVPAHASAPPPFFSAALPQPVREVDERLRATETPEGLRERLAGELVGWRERQAQLRGALPDGTETLAEARRRLAFWLRRGPEHPLADRQPLHHAVPRALALVGPTGVGKTTTLAKLAGRLRLEEGREVVLVTLDTYRVAAVEQLRAYADMLDVPFHVAFTPQDLREVVRHTPPEAHILVDTTGRSPRDASHLAQLRGFLGGGELRSWLVLAAPARPSCLREAAERFGVLTPAGLVLTKLDETDATGEVLAFAMEQPMPVLLTTAGQEVPSDLDPAPPEALAAIMLGARCEAELAA
ncbi:MAG: hypothetical protein D6776_04920 [Planctomycetota bacterium]|nr:MAG: hypothetical protein D6776_04920 [Planctomycetota bacterium]